MSRVPESASREAGRLSALAAVCILCLASASAQKHSWHDLESRGKVIKESFEERMKMYSDWSHFTSRQARRLVAESPLTAPPPPPPPGKVKPFTAGGYSPPPPKLAVTPYSASSSYAPAPPSYGSADRRISAYTASTPAEITGPGGTCNTLQYIKGFVNVTVYNYKTVKNTTNFGHCCYLCGLDPYCLAWTRVAGGSTEFRTCYFKSNLTDYDLSPDAFNFNQPAALKFSKLYPELRYVNEGYPSTSEPLILESGTKAAVYPSSLYGCPYPQVSNDVCPAPPTCNCYKNICYGSCL